MAAKLNTGDSFPKLALNLVDGGRLELPDGLDARYRIILFYRGHW
jgi:peroxiredoxin